MTSKFPAQNATVLVMLVWFGGVCGVRGSCDRRIGFREWVR